MKSNFSNSRYHFFLRHLPIFLGLGWSVCTILLYAYGPFVYYTRVVFRTYTYLVVANLVLLLGYVVGYGKSIRVYDEKFSPTLLIKTCCFFTIVETILLLLAYSDNIFNIGLAFEDPFAAREAKSVSPVNYFFMFVSPFSISYIPLSVFHWKIIGVRYRVWTVAFLLVHILYSIGIATRHDILFFSVLVGSSLLASSRYYAWRLFKKKTVIIAAGLLVLFGSYSGFIAQYRTYRPDVQMEDRFGAVGQLDEDNLLYQLTPDDLHPVLLQGTAYYTHGYQALSRCLEKPFIGVSWGLGHSPFLIRNYIRLTGNREILRHTYYERLFIEDGWLKSRWITAYPWIASDVTFPGSIVILFIAGYLLAATWKSVTINAGTYNIVLFAWMCYFFASLPQGSITQDGMFLTAFSFALVGWFLTRHSKKSRILKY